MRARIAKLRLRAKRRVLDWLARHSRAPALSTQSMGQPDLVVSLTTIPHRVGTLHMVVESIFRQSVRPHRVVLWIGRGYFPDDSWLTPPLRKQLTRGLTIMYDEREWPHKKLIPSLKAFPSSLILTIDDDVIYSRELIRALLDAHEGAKGPCVAASLTRRVLATSPDCFSPYAQWLQNVPSTDARGFDLLPLGVGGVLYPPDSLHPDVLNEDLALQLAPKQDDLWFKMMALRNAVGVVQANVPHGFGAVVAESSQSISLWAHNVRGHNDAAWDKLCKEFDVGPSDLM